MKGLTMEVMIGIAAGSGMFSIWLLIWYLCRARKEKERIVGLTDYLEKVNTGQEGVLLTTGEDAVSRLQDEIYKTVTELYQTREAALKARQSLAENMDNIAHQIKTPITSLSLSVQMMSEAPSSEHLKEIRKQISRLTYLEESLLLLSRIDAGTLFFNKKEVDVFTVLTLAADNLQELFKKADVSVQIPELGEMLILADMDWTMEAVMNLVKNCMEHTPRGGCVHCSYEENPLYVQIRIWDEGAGFAEADVFHLFDRFYRGEGEKSGGIGIGLSLAKEIIEMQRGNVSAFNLPSGGGCFEIRFYRH